MNSDFIYYFKNAAINIFESPKICVVSLQNAAQSNVSLDSLPRVMPLKVFVLLVWVFFSIGTIPLYKL